MTGPTLSVVITCRNEAQWLPAMLASLRAEEVEGWVDTVVVDDGSEDDTADVARRQGHDLPGIRVVSTPPTNRSTATNAGIAASTGDAVVLLDGDDEVAPGYLAALQAALVDHPFVAARMDDETLNQPWQHAARPSEQVHGLRAEPGVPWLAAGGGTIAVRRDVLARVGGFDEDLVYAQDTDLCWRLALVGVEPTFVPEAVLRYRYRDSARMVFRQARRYGRGRVVLDHRFGWWTRSWGKIGRRSVALGLQVLRLPLCVNRKVRFATAFRAGSLLGWLQAALRPGHYFSPESLTPVNR